MVSRVQNSPVPPSSPVKAVQEIRSPTLASFDQLQGMLGSVVKSCKTRKEMVSAVERLIKPFSLEVLQEMVRLRFPGFKGVADEIEEISKEATWYSLIKEDFCKVEGPGFIAGLLHSFFVSLESFLRALGLTDFFKPVVGDYDAELKGQKMVLLSTLFSTLTTMVVPLLGPAYGGAAICAVMASLAGLSLSYPFWRPIPSYLPKVENWTEKYALGALQVKRVKTQVIDQIVEALRSTESDHLQVLLVGPDGSGKTEIVKALAGAFARGDYPEFRKSQVFHINTADLLSHTEWVPKSSSTLSFFSDALEGHRAEIVFVFDQIHLACQLGSENLLSDQLKAMFDREKDCFPHVIGITTESDFASLTLSFPSFIQRFRVIKIDELTDEETVFALHQTLLKIAPETIIEKDALKVLVQKTKEAFGKEAVMPKSALRILSKCIQKVSKAQRIDLEIEVEKLQRELILQRSEKVFSRDKDLKSLEENILKKQRELIEVKKEVRAVFEMRKLLLDMKETIYQLASQKISGNREKSFLIFSRFLLPSLEQELKERASRLNLKIGIDPVLISQVMEEELRSINFKYL